MALDIKNSNTYWLVCGCGNQPHTSGFYPCTMDGEVVEPVIGGPWDGHLYLCMGCGCIYDAETLEQYGQVNIG